MSNRTLFLDLDGVLADFDAAARRVLNTDNSYKYEFIYGAASFWAKLDAAPEFFYNMPLMPDARELWEAVEHLRPTILTALPKSDAASVNRQKRAWVAEHFGIDVQVITCTTYEKPNYCNPGDILVDDRNVNSALWTQRDGLFVLHESAASTIETLTQHGVLP